MIKPAELIPLLELLANDKMPDTLGKYRIARMLLREFPSLDLAVKGHLEYMAILADHPEFIP